MSLACSNVQPVPALFSVKIPASLNANNSPLLATWVFVQASPEGSTGRSEFHDVSDRFTELMVPCVVVTNRFFVCNWSPGDDTNKVTFLTIFSSNSDSLVAI